MRSRRRHGRNAPPHQSPIRKWSRCRGLGVRSLWPRGRPTRQSPVQRLPVPSGDRPRRPRRACGDLRVRSALTSTKYRARVLVAATEEDVKEHARRIVAGAGTTRGAVERRGAPLPDFEKWGAVERQPMSNIRRTTAQRLSHAWSTIPHVTQFDKADITEMEELRRKYREQVRQAGGDLTVTAMLVKVLSVAVKRFPQFNASIDAEADEIVYKKYVNVGVAVDTDRGLLVPVIRNADQKNLTQIAIELHQLAQKPAIASSRSKRCRVAGSRFQSGRDRRHVFHADHQLA